MQGRAPPNILQIRTYLHTMCRGRHHFEALKILLWTASQVLRAALLVPRLPSSHVCFSIAITYKVLLAWLSQNPIQRLARMQATYWVHRYRRYHGYAWSFATI
jgi:hypothetical protein